jgi:D-amino peptidase
VKVFISADMEGVCGVVDWKQVSDGQPEYERARKWMTDEVNAAIEGAIAAGATDVVVNDSHGSMRNILLEELNPAAQLILGSPKPLCMMQGVETGFFACFFIGYHSAAGTLHSNLDHTYASSVIHEVKVNGKIFGETQLNAALAGTFGIPVAMVTGDSHLADEVRATLGTHVEMVVVKEATGRSSAKCLTPGKARELIRSGAERCLRKKHAPFVVTAPVLLNVDFHTAGLADAAEFLPGCTRAGPRTIEYEAKDYRIAFDAFYCMTSLAGLALT